MALCHVFQIIVHCKMSNVSITLEVLTRTPTDVSCYSNSLKSCGITFERNSLLKTKTPFKTNTALKLYYKVYVAHL